MKVVVVYSGGRRWGGIETYLANLVRLHDGQEVSLVLASLGEWDLTRTLQREGFGDTTKLLSGRRFRLRTIHDLRNILKGEGAALVVSQGVVANAYARAASLGTGVPSLVVVHSDLALDYPRTVVRGAFLLSDRLLRRATTRYIAVSYYLKQALVRSGVKSERVTVVYNGVTIDPGRRAGGKPAGARQKASVALASVGRLHPVKNYEALVEAMRLLPEGVTLTLWGDGTERERLAALIGKLGLEARVQLRGEAADMGQALDGVDIYVQPSKSEGCSFAVAEAMLHGKPVVVTPRGGLPEQVQPGVTGVVAADTSPEALAAAITALVEEPLLAARLGEAGRLAAEQQYSMETWLRDTLTVFREAGRTGEHPA